MSKNHTELKYKNNNNAKNKRNNISLVIIIIMIRRKKINKKMKNSKHKTHLEMTKSTIQIISMSMENIKNKEGNRI